MEFWAWIWFCYTLWFWFTTIIWRREAQRLLEEIQKKDREKWAKELK